MLQCKQAGKRMPRSALKTRTQVPVHGIDRTERRNKNALELRRSEQYLSVNNETDGRSSTLSEFTQLRCIPAPRHISARLFSVKSGVIQNAMSLKTGGYFEKALNFVRMSPSVNWSRKRLSPLQNNLQTHPPVIRHAEVGSHQSHQLSHCTLPALWQCSMHKVVWYGACQMCQ